MADRPERDHEPETDALGTAPTGRDRTRLERLTDGTLHDLEQSELEAAAQDDTRIARQLDAYTPIDGIELDRITDEALERRRASGGSGARWAIGLGAGVGLVLALLVWAGVRGPSWEDAALRVSASELILPETEVEVEVSAPPEARVELWAGAGATWRRSEATLTPGRDGLRRVKGSASLIAGGIYGKVNLRAVLRAPDDARPGQPEATPPGRFLQEKLRIRAPHLRAARDGSTLVVDPEPRPVAGVAPTAFTIAAGQATPLAVAGPPPWHLHPPAGADTVVVWLGPEGTEPPADPAQPGLFSVVVMSVR